MSAYSPCRLNGGELFDYVIEREFLEESQAVDYLTQIMEAMDFCHKKNIVHLDLKVCRVSTLAGTIAHHHSL